MENQEVATVDSRKLALLTHISNGLTIDNAWKAAGYSRKPAFLANFLARPDVIRAIERAVSSQLRSQDRPRARAILVGFMEDKKLTAGTRIEAIKALEAMIDKDIARSGLGAVEKPPSEMTGDELRATIEKLQTEMGARSAGATVIEGVSEPIPDAQAVQVIDLLD